MNKFYLAGIVITLLIAIAILYWRFSKRFPSSEFDYEKESSKHSDLKSGKSREYEG